MYLARPTEDLGIDSIRVVYRLFTTCCCLLLFTWEDFELLHGQGSIFHWTLFTVGIGKSAFTVKAFEATVRTTVSSAIDYGGPF